MNEHLKRLYVHILKYGFTVHTQRMLYNGDIIIELEHPAEDHLTAIYLEQQ